MPTLNLGILAHVDAGKTTLTEGLLHAAGIIDEIGRVDDGTTQTDSLDLERQRGITIRSAVVSFVVDGVTVNLIDTPGHPDFIAEVERVLGVLDGAVLVVSAVEGVQSQTLLLFRALRRLGVPTIVFVNKIDRVGADERRVLATVADRLTTNVLPMSVPTGVGTNRARVTARRLDDPAFADAAIEALAGNDDAILRGYVEGSAIDPGRLRRALADQTARRQVLPVYFGAALKAVGTVDLLHAIPTLLPAVDGDRTAETSGTVFKVERGPTGEKIAYVRMAAGTLRTRDHIRVGGADETVTAIEVFDRGTTQRRPATSVGDIAKIHGLSAARIGDTFGPFAPTVEQHAFAPPTLETAVVPRLRGQKRAVFDALSELAEQDPLIDLRQDDSRQELFLSLYGEVQKEIVAQTLAADYGLDIEFRPTTPVCVERPDRVGAAVELIRRGRSPAHPFLATVGLEVAPLPPGSGVTFELAVGVKSIPIHVFDSVDAFRELMRRTVEDVLRQGLHGWAVTDCRVVMTDCDYQAPPRKMARHDPVGLPPPHAARADGRTPTGRNDRARTGPRVPPRDPGRRPRADHVDAERAARPTRAAADRRLDLRARGRDPRRTVPPPPETAPGADPGRGRDRVDVRRLSPRRGGATVSPAHRPQPARPRRLPPPRHRPHVTADHRRSGPCEDGLVGPLSGLIAESHAAWLPPVVASILGTSDPVRVAEALTSAVSGALGVAVTGAHFYEPGVGIVAGLQLEDGRGVVAKVHRADFVSPRHLAAVVRVQADLAGAGLPAPAPIAGPIALGHGWLTVEELRAGATADGYDPAVRLEMATVLVGLVEAARHRERAAGSRRGSRHR